jgi:hypothetical protein
MANELVSTLIDATNLPTEPLERELNRLFAAYGKDSSEVSLEELRIMMADYLQTVLLQAKEELSE